MTPPLHVALRTLDPSTSSLGTAMDYARGRSRRQVLRDVVQATTDALVAEQGADAAAWRQAYTNPGDDVCSPTGVVGPCGTMPFIERGTWIHYVGWPARGATGPANPPAPLRGHAARRTRTRPGRPAADDRCRGHGPGPGDAGRCRRGAPPRQASSATRIR